MGGTEGTQIGGMFECAAEILDAAGEARTLRQVAAAFR